MSDSNTAGLKGPEWCLFSGNSENRPRKMQNLARGWGEVEEEEDPLAGLAGRWMVESTNSGEDIWERWVRNWVRHGAAVADGGAWTCDIAVVLVLVLAVRRRWEDRVWRRGSARVREG